MPTKTSVGSGLWSAPGTWDAGVPVDDDIVVIASGHTVEFDVDQSGFTLGIQGITITGTLKLTRTAGTYYMKIKAAKTITGAGTFDCGTALDIIPFAAKHTISGGSSWYITGGAGLTFTMFGAEPQYKFARLVNNEAVGSTVIEVDTDLTGDIWRDGDAVLIANNYNWNNFMTIAAGGIAAGSITLTAGIPSASTSGNYIILVPRHIKIIFNGSYGFQSFTNGKFIMGGGCVTNGGFRAAYGINGTISGGVFYGSSEVTSAVSGLITGGVFLGATGSGYAGSTIFKSAIGGLTITGGLFACCNTLFNTESSGIVVTGGLFISSTFGFDGCKNLYLLGGTFRHCQRVMNLSQATIRNLVTDNCQYVTSYSSFVAYNSLFVGNGVMYYTSLPKEVYSESIDHNQVPGAYKAWNKGGVTTKQTVTVPSGYAYSMQTVLENAAVEGYWYKEVTVGAGASVTINMRLRKTASMTYLPRCVIFNKASVDPFSGGAALYTFTMTNSIDTWESDAYTFANSGTQDVTLIVRCQGMNASGSMYSVAEVVQINVDLTAALAKLVAIQAKTDQLAFTIANQVDANALLVDAAGVRTAIGLESANLDTQLSNIQADLDNPDQYKADVSSLALEATLTAIKGPGWTNETLYFIQDTISALPSAPSEADIVNALKAALFDGTLSFEDCIKLYNAALFGKLDGGGTGTLKFRNPADTKDRITAAVDLSNGDRDSITLDLT